MTQRGKSYGDLQVSTDCTAADLTLAPGIVLELASVGEDGREWGVWGIRIDGHLYREPRDLTPETLCRGDFTDWLRTRVAKAHDG